MHENVWTFYENPTDIECPPSGRLLKVNYENGDKIKIEFFEIENRKEFKKLYKTDFQGPNIFPITAVDIIFIHIALGIEFNNKTTMPSLTITNAFLKNVQIVCQL